MIAAGLGTTLTLGGAGVVVAAGLKVGHLRRAAGVILSPPVAISLICGPVVVGLLVGAAVCALYRGILAFDSEVTTAKDDLQRIQGRFGALAQPNAEDQAVSSRIAAILTTHRELNALGADVRELAFFAARIVALLGPALLIICILNCAEDRELNFFDGYLLGRMDRDDDLESCEASLCCEALLPYRHASASYPRGHMLLAEGGERLTSVPIGR